MTIPSNRKSHPLIGYIKITGHGSSESGEPFVRMEVKAKSTLVRVNNLLGDRNFEFARLQRIGANLLDPRAQKELIARIEAARRESESFNVATALGWYGEVFIFPDGVVPAGWSDVEIYLEDEAADTHRRFLCRGTRAGTMKLFALFVGNSRLMFGAALACVGPLSPVIRPEHVAAQFVGEGGDGKTSGAVAISSIWGGDTDPNHRLGSGTSWENTKLALEKYAAAHNNMLLFLDESDSAEGEDIRATVNSLLKAIKSIAGGKGKGRGNDPNVRTSYTPYLGTSNLSVPQMLKITRRRVADFAYIDRLLDIPAPAGGHGFFENLHGYSDLGKFRDKLDELACLHYGLAGRAYVWHIAHALRNDRDEFVAFLRERREQYVRAVAHLIAPGRKLLRVHGKFATIYFAGCAAIRFKILPFTEADLLEAVKTCERDHIAFIAKGLGGAYALDAAPTAPAPPRTPYQALKAYLNGPVVQTFIDLRTGASVPAGHVHESAPGYLGLYRGHKEIWLSYACFERIAGGSDAAKTLMAELDAKRLIASERRGQRSSFSVKREIPGLGRVRVIALRAP
jgi:hypothetical protein